MLEPVDNSTRAIAFFVFISLVCTILWIWLKSGGLI